MKIDGIERVNAMLKRKEEEAKSASVIVGYTAAYAIFVHENMEPKNLGASKPRPSGLGVFWGPSNYGPKFLEGPAREYKDEIVKIILSTWAKTHNVLKSLLVGGLRLQRESQLRVPVEYGNLRASAFTREADE